MASTKRSNDSPNPLRSSLCLVISYRCICVFFCIASTAYRSDLLCGKDVKDGGPCPPYENSFGPGLRTYVESGDCTNGLGESLQNDGSAEFRETQENVAFRSISCMPSGPNSGCHPGRKTRVSSSYAAWLRSPPDWFTRAQTRARAACLVLHVWSGGSYSERARPSQGHPTSAVRNSCRSPLPRKIEPPAHRSDRVRS